jgi:hypothetical protein
MLEGAMLVWFILTGFSAVFVLWDSVFNGVTSWVQRIAWILVTLYTGPVGAFMYLLGCRRPFPGGHDRFTDKTWKQGLNSEMHCLAGDATGIIIAAIIVPALALANGWDLVIEYTAGFISGLLIFQALMMADMYAGNYLLAVRKTFFAETVSMNLVMTGMIPTMVILAALWPGAHDPLRPEFWFHMSLATVVGGIFAFPINYWLVKNHLKHGCMTLPGADHPAPGLGHRSPEAPNPHMEHAMEHQTAPHPGGNPEHGGMQHAGTDTGEEAMTMRELPLITSLLWIGGTFLVLLAAVWLTAIWVPIRFSAP